MSSNALAASVIEPVGGHGGMNYYDAGLCAGLGRAGIDVTLHTCERNPPQPTAGQRYRVHCSFNGVYGKDPAWKRGLRYVRGLTTALWTERRRGARVAHFHFFHVGPLEFLGVRLARWLGLRVVVTAHDVESFKAELSVPRLVQRSYALVDGVVAHNHTSAREVMDKLGVPPDRVHVIPHGSYVDFLGRVPDRHAARAALGLAGHEGPVLLFFGQIKEVKGLDLLIQAHAQLLRQRPDTLLIIAGKVWKDDFGRYDSQIEALGTAERIVRHIRYIPDEAVANYYAAADLVVLPYRRIYQSGVLLMAMSYGTPVLASDLDAMREVVQHQATGFLFRQGDADDLCAQIDAALADPVALERVSAQALQAMRGRFSWRDIGHQTARLYESLAPARRAGSKA